MIKYPYHGNRYDNYNDPRETYTENFLRDLFRSMLRIRMIEEAIEVRYHEDQMKSPIHLAIGQEATSVGSCAALARNDQIFCSHRTHGHYFGKGGDLKAMLSELHCRTNGCAGSRGGSMHLLDKEAGVAGGSAIVGGSIPIATGFALSAKLRNKSYVTVAYMGDAAAEEGVCWESFNFAALKQLPILYICENNYYSVCSPLEYRQPNAPLYKKAASFGIAAETIDGNNVLEMYEATKRAVERARQGQGATFIEAHTYRWRGHHGSGDDSASGYRDPQEVKQWQQFCPVKLFDGYLSKWNIIDDSIKQQMRTEITAEIEAAFIHALNSPNPQEKDLYAHVYAE